MNSSITVDSLFERFIEHHIRNGEQLAPETLCTGRPDLLEPLRARVADYLTLDRELDSGVFGFSGVTSARTAPEADRGRSLRLEGPQQKAAAPLPAFEGFQTIERLGRGGMGEVYKALDLKLGRLVAAKVIRKEPTVRTGIADFLREAQALALFQDDHIIQVHEFREQADPPVLIMEYLDGFELGRLGPSLEFRQRARILLEVCEAIHRAHALGLQHRDLKPSNILLDAALKPKIVDFGLAGTDPTRGHFKGTLAYLAPEQLDPSRPIDALADVYALGVILYELLAGALPYTAASLPDLIESQKAAAVRLPIEIDPAVPEPLQAIALKAMERDPDQRYPSAHEMAVDLRRYLEGRPVLARPTQYGTELGRRLRPHLLQIEEWLRLKLIYPHEATRLLTAYRPLEAREDDWIIESRTLSYSQIALYLGAFLLLAGGLLYYAAHRFFGAVEGLGKPLLVLGLPLIGLSAAGYRLYRREHKAVAVGFAFGALALLPLLLLILFHEARLWNVAAETAGQLFQDGSVSNRQIQMAALAALVSSAALAWATRTTGLSSAATFLTLVVTLALCADFGLRDWLEQERWDLLAFRLAPLALLQGVGGRACERFAWPWFSRPLYVGTALLTVIVLELLALEGRLFGYLGLTMASYQQPDLADPKLLDTLAAMTLNGVVFYLIAWVGEWRGTEGMRGAVWLLFVISPFAALEPLAYLNETGHYAENFLWIYLGLSLGIAALSHHRQRRSFYTAGLINTGYAIWEISERYEWFDEPSWATSVVAMGIAILVVGFLLDRMERSKRRVVK